MPGDACDESNLAPYESLIYDMPPECDPPPG